MIEKMDGTVTLVTGAAGGIGKAICQSLYEAGATVIATDIKGQLPDSQKPDFISDWVDLDVREEAHWVEAMKIISKRYGRLDVLVNNAAVAPVVKLEEMSLEDWQRCQSINTNGIFLGLKYALAGRIWKTAQGRRFGHQHVLSRGVGCRPL